MAERRLTAAAPGREQNELARDSYSYLHFPMVAGIVLVALGMKKTIAHVEDPLKLGARRSRCWAGWASTCSPTWPSGCAISTRSTSSAWCSAGVLFALFPLTLELPALAALAS